MNTTNFLKNKKKKNSHINQKKPKKDSQMSSIRVKTDNIQKKGCMVSIMASQ